jgi:Ca2+-binding RTX toxin-like protein
LLAPGGADVVVGGGGSDVIIPILFTTEPVLIDLTAGWVVGGEVGSDIVRGVENGSGTQADDTLIGNAADNFFHGNGGDDHIEGREGDDRLLGGAGVDFLDGGIGTDECIDGETLLNCEAWGPGRGPQGLPRTT